MLCHVGSNIIKLLKSKYREKSAVILIQIRHMLLFLVGTKRMQQLTRMQAEYFPAISGVGFLLQLNHFIVVMSRLYYCYCAIVLSEVLILYAFFRLRRLKRQFAIVFVVYGEYLS